MKHYNFIAVKDFRDYKIQVRLKDEKWKSKNASIQSYLDSMLNNHARILAHRICRGLFNKSYFLKNAS